MKIMFSHKYLTTIPNQEKSRYSNRLKILTNYQKRYCPFLSPLNLPNQLLPNIQAIKVMFNFHPTQIKENLIQIITQYNPQLNLQSYKPQEIPQPVYISRIILLLYQLLLVWVQIMLLVHQLRFLRRSNSGNLFKFLIISQSASTN